MTTPPGPASTPPATDSTGLGIQIDFAPANNELSVEKAWANLMRRIGVTTPALVQDGHRLLVGVDRITGLKSR